MEKKTLENYLTGLLDRRVTVEEAAELVGLKRAQYTKRRDDDSLTTEHLLQAFRTLGMAEPESWSHVMDMGYVDRAVITEALNEGRGPGSTGCGPASSSPQRSL